MKFKLETFGLHSSCPGTLVALRKLKIYILRLKLLNIFTKLTNNFETFTKVLENLFGHKFYYSAASCAGSNGLLFLFLAFLSYLVSRAFRFDLLMAFIFGASFRGWFCKSNCGLPQDPFSIRFLVYGTSFIHLMTRVCR